jgi:hypothetical protein
MIYQHATSERDQQIAQALNLMIEAVLQEVEHADTTDDDPTDRAA